MYDFLGWSFRIQKFLAHALENQEEDGLVPTVQQLWGFRSRAVAKTDMVITA